MVEIRIFPRDDGTFAERVLAAVEGLAPGQRDSADRVARRITTELEPYYPALHVRLRDALADYGAAGVYVYRDGSPKAPTGVPVTREAA